VASASASLNLGGSAGDTDSITGELMVLVFLELGAPVWLRWFSRHNHGG
jgi:hypothetical protein